jgi:hypothetical protein
MSRDDFAAYVARVAATVRSEGVRA